MLAKFALTGNSLPPQYVDDVFKISTYTGNGGTGQPIPLGFNIGAGDEHLDKVPVIIDFNNSAVNRVTGTTLIAGGDAGTWSSNTLYAKFDVAKVFQSSTTIDNQQDGWFDVPFAQPNLNEPWCIEFYHAGGSAFGSGGAGGSGVLILNIGDPGGSPNLYIHIDNYDGTVTVNVSAAGAYTPPSLGGMTSNSPQPIKINFDGTTIRLYINGGLAASSPFTGWPTQPQVTAYQGSRIRMLVATGDSSTARGRVAIQAVRYTFGVSREGEATYTQPPPSVKDTGAGLIWTKQRGATVRDHFLVDTVRGIPNGNASALATNTTAASSNIGGSITRITNTDYRIGSYVDVNSSSDPMVSWTFKKAPKFFDVLTYTGNGATNRQITHSLGSVPGMIIIKQTSGAGGGWYVLHRNGNGGSWGIGQLESTIAFSSPNPAFWGNGTSFTTPTETEFTVSAQGGTQVNGSGNTYIVYLFGHDTSTDGLIQCGNFAPSAGVANVNLGWEPQFVMTHAVPGGDDWNISDTVRNMSQSITNYIMANSSAVESTGLPYMKVNPTGFSTTQYNKSSYVYMAIRRSNKPPTKGTEVFSPQVQSTNATSLVLGNSSGWPVDLLLSKRVLTIESPFAFTRLQGSEFLYTGSDVAAGSFAYEWGNSSGGVTAPWASGSTASWSFKRAPGVMDVICYSGTGVARTEVHGLGVAPELVFIKKRSVSDDWAVWGANLPADKYLTLNSNAIPVVGNGSSGRFTAFPDASSLFLGASSTVNQASNSYVAFMFATKAGVSKVGNYTGNGSNQVIGCGFTTGARFILIKRTDAVGNWFVWDSARNIVAGDDPYISLNSTAVEVTTDDSVDPDTSGFIVNQLGATNINVNAATYIYLAIA